METRSRQRRETVPALQAIKSLRKLKRMLSLVEVAYADPSEIDWSELDANADTEGDPRDGVKLAGLTVTMETYQKIVGEFRTILPYVEAVLKQSKR